MATQNTSRRVDDRVKVTLENSAQNKHRSFFLLVGDKGRDKIVNIHQMVSKANHKAKVNVLWCYKKELSFGSASKYKRASQFKKEVERGISTVETNSEFEVFLAQTAIRFCYYKDTHKVLGQTFGMCVLQDFEALTPNLLARTMETVEGGGCIVLLIRTLKSLKQLYSLTMDIHQRYRTSQHSEVVPRFNERFLLSLADCASFLCVNDKLEVLPFTSRARETLKPVAKDIFTEEEKKLKLLQQELKDNPIVGPIVQICVTLNQAAGVLSLMEAIAEKSLSTTATVTAGRGRGKYVTPPPPLCYHTPSDLLPLGLPQLAPSRRVTRTSLLLHRHPKTCRRCLSLLRRVLWRWDTSSASTSSLSRRRRRSWAQQ